MSSDKIDVGYVAKLARIALDADEIARFGSQLGGLLEHVRALDQLPLDDVPATAQVIPSRSVMRDDVERPSLSRAVVLGQAPQAEGRYFRVPRIIAEDAG
ncbi:MAG: Asp-tRNA(Asn)/Glu-tRNA(Gln) amidotransferase subunit GatC [Candidatus Dormibacteria bacterium]